LPLETEHFEEWFKSSFLFSRGAASPLLVSENKTMKAKFLRICEVCKLLIENPEKDTQEIREQIAMKYFISMRCSLDYINYAKVVLRQWKTAILK
jgi:hypothetical protein